MEEIPNEGLVFLAPINNLDTLFFEPLSPIWLEKEPKRHYHHDVDYGPGEHDYQTLEHGPQPRVIIHPLAK